MVLLHTSMRFRGLAGLAMLLTVVEVASGVVGRYLYTSVPRELDEAGPDESLEEAEARAERLLARREAFSTWHSVHVPLTWVLFTVALIHAAAGLLYATLQR
jgi:cytochrome b561